MAKAPEALYNQASRQIDYKVEVYFDGETASPLSMTQDNYLISVNVLEEVSSSSGTPWGDVSANELNVSIYNREDLFNPSNKQSPYYNRIKTGILMRAFCRPLSKEEYDWDPLGEFYIAEWTTAQSNTVVDIIAYDKISDITEGTTAKMRVYKSIKQNDFIRKFFELIDQEVVIDDALKNTLPFGYHIGDNTDFLNNVSEGMHAFIFCNHTGDIIVQYMRRRQGVAHFITDHDQIIEITTQHGITTDYDGIEVVLKAPQLKASSLLTVKEQELDKDGMDIEAQNFSQKPVADVTLIRIPGDGIDAKVDEFTATSVDIDYHIENSLGVVQTIDLYFDGHVVETADTTYSDKSKKLLSMNNIYIQTAALFESAKRFMNAFVENKIPILEIEVRGNPQYQIGEKIRVDSTRFNTTFEGVLIRQNLRFDGGLSGTLTLMNSEILEVE